MKNIYTIPSYVPFADSLVSYVLTLCDNDPLILSKIVILLPSKAACCVVMDAFVVRIGQKGSVLPKIEAIADVNTEEMNFSFLGKGIHTPLPKVVSTLEQRLLLTQLVQQWQRDRPQGGKELTLEQSARLASELASFLGQIQYQGLSIADLKELVPEELLSHWEVTLQFLQIISHSWPELLNSRQMVDPLHSQNLLLEMQARYWQEEGKDKIVVIVPPAEICPAMMQLIAAIIRLPHGKMLLPGLDLFLSEEVWQNLSASHPQYQFKQLLAQLQLSRSQVLSLEEETQSPAYWRAKLMSLVMLPADYSHYWQLPCELDESVLNGLSYIKTSDLQEEAEVIALYLRRALTIPGQRVALMTHERALARKVCAILTRWNIIVEDAAGISLSSTPEAVFLRLLLDIFDNKLSMRSLLALLKHPYCAMGHDPHLFRQQLYQLEKEVLRGKTIRTGLDGILKLVKRQGLENLVPLLEQIKDVLDPFLALRQRQEIRLPDLLRVHMEVACALATSHTQAGQERLLETETGQELFQTLDEMFLSAVRFRPIAPADYRGLFDALLAGKQFKPKLSKHPRLAILSPTEAWVMPFDFVILGGLNDGVWPAVPVADPWLSSSMRTQFGLPAEEKMIGRAAYDFIQLLGSKKILLTRSEKVNGTQTIPSRWLAKLEVILKSQKLHQKFKATEPWEDWLESLNQVTFLPPLLPPAPTPSVSARPTQMSVTDIGLWMRDPYAIYAKKILKLKQLDPLDYMPTMADFGNMVHYAIEHYIGVFETLPAETHFEYLCAQGKQILDQYSVHPITYEFWWKRFEQIARWFVKEEQEKRRLGTRIYSELRGEIELGGLTVVAKVDRIELLADDTEIIDYKTGTIPSKADVKAGFSPQMILEALIAQLGGFQESKLPQRVTYWLMKGNTDNAVEKKDIATGPELALWVENAKEGLQRLIETFNLPETPYMAVPNPNKTPSFQIYEHLERVKEWR